MARDPYFRTVKSLPIFDSENTGLDPNAGYLVAYADFTEKIQLDVFAGWLNLVGAPVIEEVAGRMALRFNGSNAIYFALGRGLNASHTIEFEVYIPSLTLNQYYFGVSNTNTGGDIMLSSDTTGVFTWNEQNNILSSFSGGISAGWHTVAITYDTANGDLASVYIDGVRKMTGTATASARNTNVMQLGRIGWGYATNGTAIRKLRVYRGIAKYTGASYAIADPGPIGRFIDVDGALWCDNGAVSITDVAKYGRAPHFAGSGGLVRRGIDFGANDFTVEGWFLLEGPVTDWPRIINQTGMAAGFFLMQVTPENKLGLVINADSNTTGTRLMGVATISAGWHHFAIVRKGNAAALFLDGVVQCAAPIYGAITGGNPFAVGMISNDFDTTSRLYGAVDDLRVSVGLARYDFTVVSEFYNTVLIDYPLNTSYPLNNNNRNKLVTLANLVSVTMGGPFGVPRLVTSFNGSSSVASLAQHADLNFGVGDFTVEWWGYATASTLAHCLLASSNANFNSAGGVGIYQSGDHVRLASYENGNPVAMVSGDYLNAWHHFVVERVAGVARIYVDGVLGASAACASAINFAVASTIYIGRSGWSASEYYKGYITGLRVVKGMALYDGSFTPADFNEVTGSFTPPEGPFAAAATTVSGTVVDLSNNPCSRVVRAYSHSSGKFLGEAVSDPTTGVFEIAVAERVALVAFDTEASGQNAVIADRIDPL